MKHFAIAQRETLIKLETIDDCFKRIKVATYTLGAVTVIALAAVIAVWVSP